MATAQVTCAVCEVHAEAVFRVEGLDCNDEVVILERRLKPMAGVEAISADVVGQRLRVSYDAAKLNTATMVDAVAEAGMRMWLEHEEPRALGVDVRARFWLTAASGAMILAGIGAAAQGFAAASIAAYVVGTVTGAAFPARRAIGALRARTLDINALMVVAASGAVAIGEWREGATVVFLFALAQWLEARTLARARGAIRALLDLSPRDALVRRGGIEQRVPIEAVAAGDAVIVRPGDKIPVDGTVASGHSDVNEAPITGESLPADKGPGSDVYAGTINGHGALELTVTRVGRDTRVARIIHLVEEAQARRAPIQSFVDRFGRIYTPAVIAAALAVALVPPMLGAPAVPWIYRALVLLVVSCPCALVISTPVSIVAAVSAAASRGVLIKGGASLERLAAVKVVAFDKTGTLTGGELGVAGVEPAAGFTRAEVLAAAAAVDAHSSHPVAVAIVAQARRDGLAVSSAAGVRTRPGLGVEGRVDGRDVMLGNARLMALHDIDVAAARPSIAGARVLVAIAGRLAGGLSLVDRPRAQARDALDLLRRAGVRRVAMLTGDESGVARRVAADVGVDEYQAALMPDQKHEAIGRLRAAYGPVAMVGDGINDAPALAAADVGIAMGAVGSDVAIEAADVALMSDELLKLPFALRLARATLRNVKTNVAVSIALKAVFLVAAVTGTATLWMAVLADTGASVIVVANALRLLRAR
ncbi:MAG TPA: cation-translocating P-type ATPase [Vicinamibacterales bacterium]|jgi:Cd2+/Zn2+-exporting ATPase|nr:cation-translocating P-type ATPase [Vicinamibacterales bacterium]